MHEVIEDKHYSYSYRRRKEMRVDSSDEFTVSHVQLSRFL